MAYLVGHDADLLTPPLDGIFIALMTRRSTQIRLQYLALLNI